MRSQRKINPTEVYLPSGRDIVQRSIVFRNSSGKDFVLKLVASHPEVVTFPTSVFRFPPASYRTIQFRVDSRKIGQWDRLTLRGCVMPIYAKGLRQFIDTKTACTDTTREAFNMTIKFTDEFSAPYTVINLPGSATCIDSSDHPVDVEELDTCTAVNIERDVVTAEPIGSAMGYVENYKKRSVKKGCWLSNMICGEATAAAPGTIAGEKSLKSKKDCKQAARSTDPNVGLEATPCGGSTIQT